MIPLDEDDNALIIEWLVSSRKSGRHVKIALLSGAKALIGLTAVEKWATEWRDDQAEHYYFRGNMFQLFLDALYNERKYAPRKSTQGSPDEPESTIGGEVTGRGASQKERG